MLLYRQRPKGPGSHPVPSLPCPASYVPSPYVRGDRNLVLCVRPSLRSIPEVRPKLARERVASTEVAQIAARSDHNAFGLPTPDGGGRRQTLVIEPAKRDGTTRAELTSGGS